MSSRANINLPNWRFVVWIAAAFCIFSNLLDLQDVEWGDYVSVPGTIMEFILWIAILIKLQKNKAISSALMVLIVLAISLRLVSEISSLIFDESILIYAIYFVSWIITMIVIIASYSGAFRKYGIIELLCQFGFIVLYIIADYFEVDLASTEGPSRLIWKYALIPLLYFPYQALAGAVSEREEGEESEE